MPTPRPIIVASVGATVGTSATWLSSVMSERPITRPTIAVTMGRPMATTVPNVNRRTSTAIVRPTASLECVSGLDTFWPR
jgi:hypothetical protein